MSSNVNVNATIKVLVFGLRDLYLGARLDQVRRVIQVPSLGGVAGGVGIAEIEGKAITVMDLEHKLYPDTPLVPKPYLLLLAGAETYGLLLPEAPSLYTVPLTQIRQLPASYRQGGHLGLATHLALVPQEQNSLLLLEDLEVEEEPSEPEAVPPLTVFLLDTAILLTTLVPRLPESLRISPILR